MTVLRIDNPARPTRRYRFSHLSLYVVSIALLVSVGAVGLRMADYDAKRLALRKQLALTTRLIDERDRLLNERDTQTQRLIELAQEVQSLQEELTTVQAFRQKVQQLLSDGPTAVSFDIDRSQAAAPHSADQLAMGGGHPNEEELLEWAQDELQQADTGAGQLKEQMERLEADVRAFNRQLNHTPSIRPVEGWITSEFGYRVHPITRDRLMHDGIDIAAPQGTPVRATGDGEVTLASWDGGNGLAVVIDHDYGIDTLYAHNSRLAAKVGDFVRKGEVIAYVGSTGLSTGPHLHYQVMRNSKPVDPWEYLPANAY